MKVTALVAAVSLALGGLLAGCGEQGDRASSGGSSASGTSSSSGATGTDRSSGGMSGSGSASQDPAKRAPAGSQSK